MFGKIYQNGCTEKHILPEITTNDFQISQEIWFQDQRDVCGARPAGEWRAHAHPGAHREAPSLRSLSTRGQTEAKGGPRALASGVHGAGQGLTVLNKTLV